MKRALLLLSIALCAVAAPLRAHDLFLTLQSFFVSANAHVEVRALNGTFTTSESVVARDRMRDVTVRSPAGTVHPDSTHWRDDKKTSVLSLRTGDAGTYSVGMSTHPKILRLEGKAFNTYLASEGVPAVLAARRRSGELALPARERYSKHVKLLLQVGDRHTDEATAALGYPAELIPRSNPYALRAGAATTLVVRAMLGGAPAPDLVLQFGGLTRSGTRIPMREVRTNANGDADLVLRQPGRWYVKFIHMTKLTGDPDADYESRWATLTFEIR